MAPDKGSKSSRIGRVKSFPLRAGEAVPCAEGGPQ